LPALFKELIDCQRKQECCSPSLQPSLRCNTLAFFANALDENKKRINTFSSRVKYAPHGESPLLSDNQIKEDELLQIYKTDLKLLESINAFRINANNLTPIELKEKLNICLEIYDKRDNIINELK
jgi:hypothetical protein